MSMTSVRSRAIARQRRAVTSPAVAAALAQLAQAAGSFVLQVVAAHALGARGLGVVSLCLGVIILVTAVTSGLVGDSLTVLDRHEPSVRAALQGLTLVMVAGGSTLAALALNLTGILDGPQAVAFAVATAVFQLEEVLRRVLMAALRFWTLLIVDGAAVGSTLVALAVLAATGEIEVGSFLVAIAIGQSVGIVVAALVLPVPERRLVPFVTPAFRQVLSFGGWRGAQVALTPLGLTASRLVVLSATGAIALGEVEAARVLGAPALLVVQGLGAYLLSTYARDRDLDARRPAPPGPPGQRRHGRDRRPRRCRRRAARPAHRAGRHRPRHPRRRRHRHRVGRVRGRHGDDAAVHEPGRRPRAPAGRPRSCGASTSRSASVCSRSPWACCRPRWPSPPSSSPSDPFSVASSFVSSSSGPRPLPSRRHHENQSCRPSRTRGPRRRRRRGCVRRPAGHLGARPTRRPPTPIDTVGADALPTWQINGVVWSQAVVGNTVYVTGSFTKARPPGVAVGGAGEVPALNIFAYDVRTGNPVAGFSHSLNAQGLVVRGSADGSPRLRRRRLHHRRRRRPRPRRGVRHRDRRPRRAGRPTSAARSAGSRLTPSTVYVGGNFPSANGQPRTNLASFAVSNAAMSSWAPDAPPAPAATSGRWS